MHPIGINSNVGPADPYFSSVQLLLHGNGANLSTTITDSSTAARSLTVAGDTSIRTGTRKFGSGSIYFDGTGDYIYDDTSSIWTVNAAQDFTIEYWIYPITGAATYTIPLELGNASGGSGGLLFEVHGTTGSFQQILDGVDYGGTVILDAWNFIAFSRVSSVVYPSINGIILTAVGNPHDINSHLTIGTAYNYRNSTSLLHFNGYLDDIRYTIGHGRYTSNFAITSEFPNH